MTFSRRLKAEVVKVPLDQTEMLAEVLAFLHLNARVVLEENEHIIYFKTKLPLVGIRFLKSLKTLYGVKTELSYTDKTNITSRTINIRIDEKVNKIISEHGLLDRLGDEKEFLTSTDEQKKAYLRAAFLSTGSVNSPSTSEYHLEIYADNEKDIIFLQRLLNYFNFNAKIIKRRKGYIVYLKEAERIADFIILIGGNNTLFEYEDIRIQRDFKNSLNRLMNCEIANQQKTFDNSYKIMNTIAYLEKINAEIMEDPLIKEAVDLRKENPQASLSELVGHYEDKYGKKISKSGLNHRYQKLFKYLNNLKSQKKS